MRAMTPNKRDVEIILRNNGWWVSRQTGSHKIYENDKGEHMTIKCSGCNKMVFRRLIKEHNLVV